MPEVLTVSENISKNSPAYASRIKRLGAHCIDWVIVSTICGAVLSLFCLKFDLFPNFCGLCGLATMLPAMPAYAAYSECYYRCAMGVFYSLHSIWFIMWVPLIIDCLYFVLMESSAKQATLGKQFFKIRVVDYNYNRLSQKTAFFRYCSKGVGTLLLFAGPIDTTIYFFYRSIIALFFNIAGLSMIAFLPKKQGLHDIVSKTICVQD